MPLGSCVRDLEFTWCTSLPRRPLRVAAAQGVASLEGALEWPSSELPVLWDPSAPPHAAHARRNPFVRASGDGGDGGGGGVPAAVVRFTGSVASVLLSPQRSAPFRLLAPQPLQDEEEQEEEAQEERWQEEEELQGRAAAWPDAGVVDTAGAHDEGGGEDEEEGQEAARGGDGEEEDEVLRGSVAASPHRGDREAGDGGTAAHYHPHPSSGPGSGVDGPGGAHDGEWSGRVSEAAPIVGRADMSRGDVAGHQQVANGGLAPEADGEHAAGTLPASSSWVEAQAGHVDAAAAADQHQAGALATRTSRTEQQVASVGGTALGGVGAPAVQPAPAPVGAAAWLSLHSNKLHGVQLSTSFAA